MNEHAYTYEKSIDIAKEMKEIYDKQFQECTRLVMNYQKKFMLKK